MLQFPVIKLKTKIEYAGASRHARQKFRPHPLAIQRAPSTVRHFWRMDGERLSVASHARLNDTQSGQALLFVMQMSHCMEERRRDFCQVFLSPL